jgi:copper chaperone
MTAPTAQTVATYTVSGMTCGHCVSSVTSEVSAIPGVAHVDVDLPTGAVTVTSAAPLAETAVAAAVAEAGYELAAGTAAESCCGSCH